MTLFRYTNNKLYTISKALSGRFIRGHRITAIPYNHNTEINEYFKNGRPKGNLQFAVG